MLTSVQTPELDAAMAKAGFGPVQQVDSGGKSDGGLVHSHCEGSNEKGSTIPVRIIGYECSLEGTSLAGPHGA